MPIQMSSRVSPKLLGFVAAVVALLLVLSTGSCAVREIRLALLGARASGRVVSWVIPNDRTVGARVEVDVQRPGAAPFRVHLVDAARGGWEEGMEVSLVCTELAPESRSCEVYSPGSWILPSGATLVILAAMAAGARKLLAGRKARTGI